LLLLLLLGLIEAINAAFTDAGFHMFVGGHEINQCLRNARAATPAGCGAVGAAGVVLAAERALVFINRRHGRRRLV
jgi:hypothetical protein